MPDKKITFFDVMLEELDFDKEKVQLEEGAIPFTPFIAFSAFKQRVFNSLKNNKMFQLFGKAKEEATELKGKALTAAEKARAAAGKTSKGTTYKLTPEQVSVMGTIYNKYGKQLVSEILDFRKNVLAPYQVIKRIIKKSSRVSSKDITGVSREEYKAALESGKKKIANRGEGFSGKTEEIRNKLDATNQEIENLEKIKRDFSKDPPEINYNYINKVAKKLDVDENPEGYSKEELKKIYEQIIKNHKILIRAHEEGELDSEEEADRLRRIRKEQRARWEGKSVDLTKTGREEFFKKGSFNIALGKYFFYRNIISKLMEPGASNIFKKTYLSIIDELIKAETDKKQKLLDELVGMKNGKTFSDKEEKVWGKLPHVKSDSGKEEDYYQKVREGDFLKQPIVIERSPALIEAENKIETEIKKFEHKLKTIMSSEDYDNLKRHRLIGNLITTKELQSPKTLFKTRAELIKETGKDPESEKVAPVEQKVSEKEEPQKKEEPEATPSITISDIEKEAREILSNEYESIDEIRKDADHLKLSIQKFEQVDKDAKSKLANLDSLFTKITDKIKNTGEQK